MKYWAYIHRDDRRVHVKQETYDKWEDSDLYHAMTQKEIDPDGPILILCPYHMEDDSYVEVSSRFHYWFTNMGYWFEGSSIWLSNKEIRTVQDNLFEALPSKRFALID